MLKDLIKIASKLDALGLYKEADRVDILIEGLATKKAGYASDPAPEVFMGFNQAKLIQAYNDIKDPNSGLWEGPQYGSAAEAFDAYLLNANISPLLDKNFDESEVERYKDLERYKELSGNTRGKLWWAVHEAASPSWEKQMVQRLEKKWNIPPL